MGSQNSSRSFNKSNDLITNALTGSMNQGVDAQNMLANALGLGDTNASNAAYNAFQNSSGYQNTLRNALAGVS